MTAQRTGKGIRRGAELVFTFDDKPIRAFAGESIAVALLAAGIPMLRTSPAGSPRGMFCGMGVCQECVVMVGGRSVAACQTPARAGLRVSSRRLIDDHAHD